MEASYRRTCTGSRQVSVATGGAGLSSAHRPGENADDYRQGKLFDYILAHSRRG
jgi:hypothetical protein